jgi:hypothetical protein
MISRNDAKYRKEPKDKEQSGECGFGEPVEEARPALRGGSPANVDGLKT